MPTKDIGGGVELVDVGKSLSGAFDSVIKQSQLAEMMNKAQAAPLDLKIKQIDAALKGNQLLNIEVDNDLKRSQLAASEASRSREKIKFGQDQVKTIMDVARNNPDLASQMWEVSFPGGTLKKNPNGTVTAVFPQSSGFKAFTANPAGVALDAKEQAAMENTLRDEWTKQAGGYTLQHSSYKAMEGLAKLGTAAADTGMIINAMRIWDPNSIVREGEVEIARKTPGIPEDLWNKYVRATTSKAPLFGEEGSLTRKKFLEASKVQVDTSRENAMAVGRGYYELAGRSGANPENVITPVGDITASLFAPTQIKEESPQTPRTPEQMYGTGPKTPSKSNSMSAGLPGVGQPLPEQERPRPKMSLDDAIRKNIFRKGP